MRNGDVGGCKELYKLEIQPIDTILSRNIRKNVPDIFDEKYASLNLKWRIEFLGNWMFPYVSIKCETALIISSEIFGGT